MKIKDTKANKIFMLFILIFFSIVFLNAKFSKRELSETTIDINKSLNIETISANINVWVKDDIDDVIVKYSTKENGSLEVDENKNSVDIKEKTKKSLFFFYFKNESPTLSIYLPSNYSQDLSLKSISGKIESYNNLNLNNLEINTTSGDLYFLDIKTNNELSIKTLSGAIKLENVTSNEIDFSSTSGEIETYTLKSNNIDISNISGEIYVDKIYADNINVSVTSSDVELDYLDIINQIDLKSVSGDIDLILNDKNYKYMAKTTSGIISIDKTEYDNNFSTSEGLPVNLKTVSGEININTK